MFQNFQKEEVKIAETPLKTPAQQDLFGDRSKCDVTIIRGEAKENLKRHKYSGLDEGLLYKYFYDPVATKLVQCLPTSVAPNTLTVLGLLCTVIPFTV